MKLSPVNSLFKSSNSIMAPSMFTITLQAYIPLDVVVSMNVEEALSSTSCPYLEYVLAVEESISSASIPSESTIISVHEKSPIAGPRRLWSSKEKNNYSLLIISEPHDRLLTDKSAGAGAVDEIERL